MDLKDIIQTGSDRLFIVDRECYLVYTGETVDDEKTFIRIGNWFGMPLEIIPMIENIIITESITGDPSCEQFNIDLIDLKRNSYIGRESEIKRFFEGQRDYGLDLNNASIVDIERDIPEISGEKIIFSKNQFIGFFSPDGNFRIIQNNIHIADIREIKRVFINPFSIFDDIHGRHPAPESFDRPGFIAADGAILIHNRNRFTSINLPTASHDLFNEMSIDPGNLDTIVFTGKTDGTIPDYIKWRDSGIDALSIFSASGNDIFAKNGFQTGSHIKIEKLSGMNITDSMGLKIKSYHRTNNLRITLPDQNIPEGISLVLVMENNRVSDIIKDTFSLILIDFKVYEKSNPLFKGITTPYAVIDDGNPGVHRINHWDTIVLSRGWRYTVEIENSIDRIREKYSVDDRNLSLILEKGKFVISEIISSLKNQYKDRDEFLLHKTLFNLLSGIRIIMHGTADRDLSAILKSAIRELSTIIDMKIIEEKRGSSSIALLIHDGNLFSFLTSGIPDPHNMKERKKSIDTRITRDRERLSVLLSVHSETIKSPGYTPDRLALLEKAINERKDAMNILTFDNNKNQISGKAHKEDPGVKNVSGNRNIKREVSWNIRKKIAVTGAITLVILFLALIKSGLLHINEKELKNQTRAGPTAADLIKKYNITANENDIYRYANQIAVKNGYHKITFSKLKEKNPDWIFPGNIFLMPDGEKITIKRGDTLWDLSKNKIINSSVEFYETFEKIAETHDLTEKKILFDKAKGLAGSDKFKNILKKTEEKGYEAYKR